MIKHEDGSVTLTKEEYTEMEEKVEWLLCLESAGVDNWHGYDVAIAIHEEME